MLVWPIVGIIFAFFAIPLTAWWLYEEAFDPPQIAAGMLLALVGALLWPITLVLAVLGLVGYGLYGIPGLIRDIMS